MRIAIFCCLLAYTVVLDAQSFSWSAQKVLPAIGGGRKIVVDKNNGVIVAGEYNDYGHPRITGSTLLSYSKEGKLNWERNMAFKLEMKMSYDHPKEQLLVAYANYKTTEGGYYISKFNEIGSEVKTINLFPMINGGLPNKIHAIATSANGYVIAGTYQTGFSLGQSIIQDPPKGHEKLFVAKFDHNDNCIWVLTSSSGSANYFTTICLDKDDNIILGGSPVGSLTLGSYTSSWSPGNAEAFIFKISSTGTVKWLTRVTGSAGMREVYAVRSDTQNNLYVYGAFDVDILNQCSILTVNANSSGDIFLVKLNSAGQCQWSKKIGGSKNDIPAGLFVDPAQDAVYVAGNFEQECVVGHMFVTSASSSKTNGVPETFLARIYGDDLVQWVAPMGTDTCGQTRGSALCVNALGAVFLTGQFKCKVSFESHPQANDGSVLFVAALKSDATTTGIKPVRSPMPFLFYPNPSEGLIKGRAMKSGEVQIEAWNSQGIRVFETSLSPNTGGAFEINLTGYPKGLYLIRCTQNTYSHQFLHVIQ